MLDCGGATDSGLPERGPSRSLRGSRQGNVCPVIKFHYHSAPRDVAHIGVRKGDRLCHVYSDTSLEELVEWGRMHGLRPEWVDRRNVLPHYDAHGEWLDACGEGVPRSELVADIRLWRDKKGAA